MPGIGITSGRFSSGGAVSASLSDDTPKLGQDVTITATATGITPTSYTFYLPQEDGSFETVTQAGNTYAWTVSKYEDFTVTVRATDGISEAVGTVDGTTTGDVDADAIITAQEAAISGSMDTTAQAWVLGFILRLKGIYTTLNENVFEQLAAANAELYAMFPDTSTTASVAGYSINAIDPSRNATMVGFVPADATVNGLTGGSGKYMIMNNAPSDYDADDLCILTYARTDTANSTYHLGSIDGSGSSAHIGRINFGRTLMKINQSLSDTPLNGAVPFGLTIAQKDVSWDWSYIFKNSDEYYFRNTQSFTSPSTFVFFGFAINNSGTAQNFFTGNQSMLCNFPSLNELQLHVFIEAIEWLQTQIGRNV